MNQDRESCLIRQLKNGPKILVDQNDCALVYGLTVTEETIDLDSIAQVALASYHEECQHHDFDDDDDELTIDSVSRVLVVHDKPIGHGGFGAVYKLESRSRTGTQTDTRLCMKIAVQSLRYDQKDDNGAAEIEAGNRNIIREADVLRKLSENTHPNIIEWRFTCTSTDNNDVFIVLEYFEADNLSVMLRTLKQNNDALPAKQLYSIMKQSADAVKFLSSLGIIHCDIKPANILYNSATMKLKIIDFGSAVELQEVWRAVEELEDEGMAEPCLAAGTAEYTAYEVLLHGFSGVKETSDIFSLGTLYYRLITQETPWHFIEEIKLARSALDRAAVARLIKAEYANRDNAELMSLQLRITDENQTFFGAYSRECELIKRMLHVDSSKRPSCDNLVSELSTFDKLQRETSRVSLHRAASDSYVPATVAAMNSGITPSTPLPIDLKQKDERLARFTAQPEEELAEPEDDDEDDEWNE